jgi:hypothetical protein
MAVHQGGDAGAVITAIFQPPQRIQDDGRGGARANNTYNATHSFLCFLTVAAAAAASLSIPGFCSWTYGAATDAGKSDLCNAA